MSALRKSIRVVAAFEAAKGSLVLVAGFGLLSLLHKDFGRLADRFVQHSHLNPAHHFPRVFLDLATRVNDRMLWMMAAGAFAYSVIRLTEAWGLWRERRWAEWLGVLSGGIYIPVEVYELVHSPNWIKVTVLAINTLCVALLARALFSRQLAKSDAERIKQESQ